MSPAETNEIAGRVNRLNARRTARAESAAHVILVVIFAILGAAALVHYLTPCEAGYLCMGAAHLAPGQRAPVQTPADDSLVRAWVDGYDTAEREHHTRGWRMGVGHGLLAGIPLGAVVMAAALLLGQMAG